MWLITSRKGRRSGGCKAQGNPWPIRHAWNATSKALGIRPSERVRVDRAVEVNAVSDPEIQNRPSADTRETGESPRTELDGYAVALECVRLVIAWYNRAIYLERRLPEPDSARLNSLMIERQKCMAERKSLARSGPEEIARVTRDYGALFRRLTDSCPPVS